VYVLHGVKHYSGCWLVSPKVVSKVCPEYLSKEPALSQSKGGSGASQESISR
jgi:hypothetical protein